MLVFGHKDPVPIVGGSQEFKDQFVDRPGAARAKILGWSVSTTMTSQLGGDAVEQAVWTVDGTARTSPA